MGKLITRLRESVFFRRGLGFVWHIAGIFLCYYLAFQFRFDFAVEPAFSAILSETYWMAAIVFSGCIVAFRLYRGLWRFFTFRDCLLTAVAFLTGTLMLGVLIFFQQGFSFYGFPRSVLIINYLLILGWEIGGRGAVRLLREWGIRPTGAEPQSVGGKRIVLVGEPDECDSLVRSLHRQEGSLGRIAAIVTEGQRHRGGTLHGIRVFSGLDAVGKVVRRLDANVVILLPPFTAPNRVRRIMDSVSAEQVSCEYRVVPSIDDIAAGRVDVSQIRRVEIVDLLNREPYKLDFERLREFVTGKTILVTGAGGSIGAEICRQVLKLKPAKLILFEIGEYFLFEIERELRPIAGDAEVRAIAGDIKNPDSVRHAIGAPGAVDIIFHAAAYKHVDLMERNPVSCIENNVLGTATLANVAEEMGVSQFVLISSDKAVRPTSVMGASKRLAERCLIERPPSKTQFKAVRFGNVLGSSGSVVPVFKAQIAAGGPVTVTSPNVTRFFMTIPEAVELVLAAGAIGDDRRILVLEMGQDVKIDTLARQMIELSGLVPEVDIPIIYSGLKPGEKEYEELLTEDENVMRTDHDRIWVVKKNEDDTLVPLDLDRLEAILRDNDPSALRQFLHSNVQDSQLMRER